MPDASLSRADGYWIGRFHAMASPCELLMDVDARAQAAALLAVARDEALRVEAKFSRYRDDSIVHRINHSNGEPLTVDDETACLLDYAGQCHALSDGLFDVTSGVLRAAWRFDGSDRVPTPQAVAALLPRVGWTKLAWQRPVIRLPAGMEIDLGGIGKEYAVDRAALLLRRRSPASVLINFGGDLYASGPRRDGRAWVIGLEDPAPSAIEINAPRASVREFELERGGMATSGDARRFLLKNGVRYSHILDPRSGWPVRDAPRSVTTVAATCTEAGILATLAMLHGARAEEFLRAQGVKFWCLR
ncbi:MAG TPA: FAD:protein FMN transferase [Acidiferrobacterales bacterium]